MMDCKLFLEIVIEIAIETAIEIVIEIAIDVELDQGLAAWNLVMSGFFCNETTLSL